MATNPALGWMPDWMKRQAGPMNTYTPTQPAIPSGPGLPGSNRYMPNAGEFVGPKAPPNPRNLPVPNMNRGWSTGPITPLGPSGRVPLTPRAPLQIGYTPTAAPFVGPRAPVEGMGDFAPRGVGGGGLGARLGGTALGEMAGVGGRLIAGGPGLVTAALTPLAMATSHASQNSGLGYERGINKVPGQEASWGAPISTLGISNTNPFTGAPVINQEQQPVPMGVGGIPRLPIHTEMGSLGLPPAPPAPPAPPMTNYMKDMATGGVANFNPDGTITRNPEWNKMREDIVAKAGGVGGNANIIPARDERAESPFNPDGTPRTGMSGGAGGLGGIMEAIKSIAPVQGYGARMSALQHGNDTWDMGELGMSRAANAGQRADEARQQFQLGALGHLGAAQMAAEGAKAGHAMTLAGEREKNAFMAPYYKQMGEYHAAQGAAVPLHAQAEVFKAMHEKYKDNPAVAGMLKTLESKQMNPADFNDYAKKVAIATGGQIAIPPMNVEG